MKSYSLSSVNGPNKAFFINVLPQKSPLKFVIVDDDENDLLIMRQTAEKSGEFVCVGMYRSSNEALTEIPKVRPHVVLMDVRMPGMDGNECARRLKFVMPQLPIIIITGLLDLDTMNHSLQTGADGYLTKPVSAAQCLAMLKLSVRTDAQCQKEMNRLRVSDRGAAGMERKPLLTTRENEIMVLLAEGLLDKEIADKLGISYSTVHFHLHNIFQKSAAENRVEAVARWRDARRTD
jgi:DNA-binding NarL/FixJ family response regulator